MRLLRAVLIISIVLITGSCYAEITGTLVDAETGQPIEGAVIYVEWTKTTGLPGLTATKLYEFSESISNKNGTFTVKRVLNPTVNPPCITIYKKGYVAWNNQYIFPGWLKRENFKLEEGITIRLEHFKIEYSRAEHVYFLDILTHWGKIINEAYRWEQLEKELKR